MTSLELWAAIDLLGGSVVTLKNGKEKERTNWEESAAALAARWEREGADGLHIIDLDAAFGKGNNREMILSIVENAKIPVQVGGGIRSRKVAEDLLESGVSRVIIGTIAYAEPETLADLLAFHGAEKIVVAADYSPDGRVMTRGWTRSQDLTVFEAAKQSESAGVVNLLVTAVGQDGTAKGPDLKTMKELCSSTTSEKMKIIASGGIRDVADLKELAGQGASGAVIGRALYDGGVRLQEAKTEMRQGKGR
jgi:phosphoribosylformimino-5-aminoimidazole carboxamide ribotide isomerase